MHPDGSLVRVPEAAGLTLEAPPRGEVLADRLRPRARWGAVVARLHGSKHVGRAVSVRGRVWGRKR